MYSKNKLLLGFRDNVFWPWGSLLVCLAVAATNCNTNNPKSANVVIAGEERAISDTAIKELPDPIDIQKLKQSFHITSGVLPTNESEPFCNPGNTYFFGFYFLIGHDGAPFGKLTIYIPHKPKNWRADNESERFSEIQLGSDMVSLWDSVHVGMSERNLLLFIDKYGRVTADSDKIVTAELGRYTARFVLKADTLNWMVVGRYCSEGDKFDKY